MKFSIRSFESKFIATILVNPGFFVAILNVFRVRLTSTPRLFYRNEFHWNSLKASNFDGTIVYGLEWEGKWYWYWCTNSVLFRHDKRLNWATFLPKPLYPIPLPGVRTQNTPYSLPSTPQITIQPAQSGNSNLKSLTLYNSQLYFKLVFQNFYIFKINYWTKNSLRNILIIVNFQLNISPL